MNQQTVWIEVACYVASALGTLLLAAIAVWQDWFRPAPKLSLKLRDAGSVVTDSQQRRLRYYHLTVENDRKWVLAKKVRVIVRHLVKIDRSNPNGTHSTHNAQLTWSPAYWHDPFPNIRNDDTCDLGFVSQNDRNFRLALYAYGNEFPGILAPGESMFVGLSLEAENFHSSELYYLKIMWNGVWDDDSVRMVENLQITHENTPPVRY